MISIFLGYVGLTAFFTFICWTLIKSRAYWKEVAEHNKAAYKNLKKDIIKYEKLHEEIVKIEQEDNHEKTLEQRTDSLNNTFSVQ